MGLLCKHVTNHFVTRMKYADWMDFVYKKLAQFAVRCALPPRRSESPGCAADNKPSCVLHLLGSFIGSRGFSFLEQRPEFWVLQTHISCSPTSQVDSSPTKPPGKPVNQPCVWVAQSCATLCDSMGCSPPGFSVHGILQARILEWIAITFFRGSSWPRDWTWVFSFCIGGRFFTVWATREALV